jgi:Mn2+/Fe2+ NRAMP family transporter
MQGNLNKRLIAIVGPGLLVAATGIGAGDLATAGFAGSYLGTAVLWAVVVGAFLKFVVTEGLARWQLATGTTLLEGAIDKFGRVFGWLFLAYLVFWSFFVGSALMSACGVTLHAMIPIFDNAGTGKIAFGILSSLLGAALVLIGGYTLFGTMMRVCIGFMFFTVISTAVMLWPGTAEVVQGLFLPTIPEMDNGGLTWTVALMGGVGGTVTVLCYGYWIREENRSGKEDLQTCRLDLATAYIITALFGIAMVIIGSTIEIQGRGATLIVTLADQLAKSVGPVGKWLFLIGAAGAVFSSLLGVWQAIPYLFADVLKHLQGPDEIKSQPDVKEVDVRSLPYRGYLAAIAVIPMFGLFHSFREIQKLYASIGAWFIPVLALSLLLLNSRTDWVGERYKNRPLTVGVLLVILVLFSWIAWKV